MAEEYDVIIVGSGAGGGTLAHRLALRQARADPRARRLAAPRGRELGRHGGLRRQPLRLAGHLVRRATARPSSRRSTTSSGGATKFYGAALYRLRERDFGELKHHGGISPAWPIGYDVFEPYYTQAEELYQVHGARGEDPTDPPAAAPYPYPPVSHEPRIQQLFDDLARVGLHPFHSPYGIMLDEAEPGLQRLHPLRHLRRLPVPGARQVRRRRDRRAAGAAARQRRRCVRNAAGAPARDRRVRSHRHLGRRRRRRRASSGSPASIVVVSAGAANSAKLLLASAERPAPERSGQRLGPGRPQLRVPQQPRVPGRLDREERHPVPEDARAQRLLLRRRRLRVPDGQRADGRQVVGADVPRREADRDQAGADVRARRRRRARRRLLAVGRGPARLPTTGSRSTPGRQHRR